jgi:hypothetical protein
MRDSLLMLDRLFCIRTSFVEFDHTTWFFETLCAFKRGELLQDDSDDPKQHPYR